MNAFSGWMRRVWYLLNRRRRRQEVQAEMEAHLEMMSEPKRFGNLLRLREEADDIWNWNWLDDIRRDLLYGLRSLRKSPGFTISACLILSFGIGLNLSFFQILNITLLQPLPVRDPDSLVRFDVMWSDGANRSRSDEIPYPAAQFLRFNNNVLSAVLTQTPSMNEIVWGDGESNPVRAAFVSANWFEELGYTAAGGRLLTEKIDDVPGTSPAIVVSREFWETQLNRDFTAVGKTVRVNGRPAVLVGIIDSNLPSMAFGLGQARVWASISHFDYFNPDKRLSNGHVIMYGRMRSGVSPTIAKDGMRPSMDALAARYPDDFRTGQWLEPRLASARFIPPDRQRQGVLLVLFISGLTLLVLVVACANLSNLVLSRTVSRVRELSIRTALGASRWKVIRHLLAESILLAVMGSAGGLLLSYWGPKVFVSMQEEIPASLTFMPDWRTALVTAGIAIVSILAVGFIPAWKVSRRDLVSAMKDGGQQASAGLGRARLRQILLAAQVGGSCVLLVIAGLTVSGLQRLTAHPGFEIENVAVLNSNLVLSGMKGAEARAYWNGILDIIAGHPETHSAALVSNAPLGSSMFFKRLADVPGLEITVNSVGPGFFDTMKVPILAGRTFGPFDDHRTTVIVSRRLAMAMYGTLDVLGRPFPKAKPERTVVGLVADASLVRLERTDNAEMYFPLDPEEYAGAHLVVRARADAGYLVAPMRQAVRNYDERIQTDVRLLKMDFARQLGEYRVTSQITIAIALLTLLLACLGIFGLVSYSATLRRKEIGIRMALGAGSRSIVGTLVKQLVGPVSLATAGGLTVGVIAGVVFESKFEAYYLIPLDVPVLLAVALILVTTATISVLAPARRALRGDILQAIRYE